MSDRPVKIRAIDSSSRRPVASASVAVEYPDTIVVYETDRKGRLTFNPRFFPVTVTVRANGMYDSTVGLVSMPDGKVTVEVDPDPTAPRPASSRRPDWSTAMQRRLRSVYVVRGSR